MNTNKSYKTIDEYIHQFPKDTADKLQHIKTLIQKSAPNAEEAIAYGIPTYRLHGNLVHFAAFAHHIGFYPTPSGIRTFKKELSEYKLAKGSVQFPLDKPLPLSLIRKI